MTTPLIEFRDVKKCFGALNVLDGIDLKIYEGEVTTIIGLSGSGKSVLLKHIIGLLTPDSGTILLRGKSVAEMTKQEIKDALSKMSYMFQGNALFDSLTVYENISLPLVETSNLKKEEIHQRVMARVEQTELTEAIDKYPSQLSGGMQKRAALARALVTDPKIVLFDEPTTGQDPVRKNAILSLIAQYQRKFGFTAILVSHEIPDVYFISNRVLALYEKKIVFQGTPEELEEFDHPFNDEVISSLESLQKELTGLYSKRQFKVLNSVQMKRKKSGEPYAIVVFKLVDINYIISGLGPDVVHEALSRLYAYIDKHFGIIGGISTRLNTDEIVTMLPHSDIEEAQSILEDFVKDFHGQGIKDIWRWAGVRRRVAMSGSVTFTIVAGIAEGKPVTEIETVIEAARTNQKEIWSATMGRGGVNI